MSHLKSSGVLRMFATVFFVCLFSGVSAQVHTPKYVSPTGNIGGFWEYLPQGYNNNETYPLIISIHGVGELGQGNWSDLPRILNTGIPRLIQNGQFPVSFWSGGQSHKFIVISPQFRNWPVPNDVNDMINYAVQNYRVNPSRIYVTGMSMGGGITWEYASAFASRVAAIVPVCGASWPDHGRAQQIASGKVAVWATHNDADGTVPAWYTNDYVTHINNNGANPPARKSIWASNSHDAWTKTYDPNYRENNLNIYEWMLQYAKGSSAPPPPPPPPPPAPTTTVSLPGKVEAEAYTSMHGVQSENTWDAGGGQNIGWIDNNDWMDYSVNPTTTGTYTVKFRVASGGSGAKFQVKKSDGTVLATVDVPSTGGWQNWQTVTANVTLTAGTQTLRIQSITWNGWNINWMDFAHATAIAPPPPPPSGSTTGTTRVEAEHYTSMHGVQSENTWDAGGGQNIGWIDNNDWMDYSINPSVTGSYTFNFRVASGATGAQFQIRKSDGSVLATVNVPATGGWQSWQTVSATVNLTAGAQTIRLYSTTWNGWNINWFEFSGSGTTSSGGGGSTAPVSSKIEAEHFTSMHGVQSENTSDAGGGLNLGWIDNGDWMDYSVNVATSGTYTLRFRVAAGSWGAQFQVKRSDGTVLSTVNVPHTGGWQNWQTVSVIVNLNAGTQTIRLQSTTWNGWNINWWELASGSSTSANRTAGDVEVSNTTGAASLEVYPNPVTDKFVLKLNNELKGTVRVQVVNASGSVVKEFNLNKPTAGTSQFYLSIGDLSTGAYVLKAQMSQWVETKQIIKQ